MLQLTVLHVKYFLPMSTTLVSISKTLMNSLRVLWQIAVDNAKMNDTNPTTLESIYKTCMSVLKLSRYEFQNIRRYGEDAREFVTNETKCKSIFEIIMGLTICMHLL